VRCIRGGCEQAGSGGRPALQRRFRPGRRLRDRARFDPVCPWRARRGRVPHSRRSRLTQLSSGGGRRGVKRSVSGPSAASCEAVRLTPTGVRSYAVGQVSAHCVEASGSRGHLRRPTKGAWRWGSTLPTTNRRSAGLRHEYGEASPIRSQRALLSLRKPRKFEDVSVQHYADTGASPIERADEISLPDFGCARDPRPVMTKNVCDALERRDGRHELRYRVWARVRSANRPKGVGHLPVGVDNPAVQLTQSGEPRVRRGQRRGLLVKLEFYDQLLAILDTSPAARPVVSEAVA
jgi:hypothetical protein